MNYKVKSFLIVLQFQKKETQKKMMRLSLSQSSPQSLTSINDTIENYPFDARILEFKSLYVFEFDMNHVYIPEYRKIILDFCKEFFRLLLLNMIQKSNQEWKQEIVNSSLKIKFQYCQLMEKFIKQKLRLKVQLVFFLITLLSPNFFEQVIDTNLAASEENLEQEDINIFSVEEYVYIVLIFQTVGTLISPQAFKYLRGKYIKRILYKSDKKLECLGIINSLRHIRQQMTLHDCFIGERRLKDKDFMNSTSLIKFVRDNLKTKFEYTEKPKKSIDPLLSSIHQTFYCERSKRKYHFSADSSARIQKKKVMTKQLSKAAITFYGLKQYQPRFKSASRPSLFKAKSNQKRIEGKSQTFFSQEEKKQKKSPLKQNWQAIISNIRNETSKNITKIEKIPSRLQKKHTNQYHKYTASQFVPFGIKTKKKNRLSILKQNRQQTLDFDTDQNTKQIMGHKYFNIKSCDAQSEERFVRIPQQQYPCSSQKLRRNQIQFIKRCDQRDEKIRDSFMNITYRIA